MYYELYIDAFFFVNFTMDYILLRLVSRILRRPASHGRICLGAVLGALGTCIVIVLPGIGGVMKFLLFHGAINIFMLKTGLGTGWDRTLFRAVILLYISGFLAGGIMEYFRQYIRTGSMFFALAVLGYSLSLGIWKLMTYLAKRNAGRFLVRLTREGCEYETEALVDTGNRLRDPVTGKPVSIISPRAAGKLGIRLPLPEEDGGEGSQGKKGVWYIPYHSVGKSEGVLPAVMLDALYVLGKPQMQIKKPVVAVCGEDITADDYEMLMNPDLLY